MVGRCVCPVARHQTSLLVQHERHLVPPCTLASSRIVHLRLHPLVVGVDKVFQLFRPRVLRQMVRSVLPNALMGQGTLHKTSGCCLQRVGVRGIGAHRKVGPAIVCNCVAKPGPRKKRQRGLWKPRKRDGTQTAGLRSVHDNAQSWGGGQCVVARQQGGKEQKEQQK